MEEPEEAATETLPKGDRGVLLIHEGRVVERVFLKRIRQRLIVLEGDGIERRKDDRFHVSETG
jgi:hypothetical protein